MEKYQQSSPAAWPVGSQKLAVTLVDKNSGVSSEHSFRNVGEVIEYIKGIDHADRYSVQTQLLECMVANHDKVADLIEEVFTYVRQSKDYQKHVSEAEFEETWEPVTAIVKGNQTRKGRRIAAAKTVLKNWTSDTEKRWIESTDMSTTMLDVVRRASKSMTFQQAVRRVNDATISRIGSPRRGISNAKSAITGDWTAALRTKDDGSEWMAAELAEKGLQTGKWGFIEEYDPTKHTIVLGNPPALDTTCQAGKVWAEPSSTPTRAFESDTKMGQLPVTPVGDESSDSEYYDAEDGGGEELVEQRPSGCQCSRDVPPAWQRSVVKRKGRELPNGLKLLAHMMGFKNVCYMHLKAMGGHLGLQLKLLKAPQLLERLEYIHRNRLYIGALKTQKATYQWFRVKNRPAQPTDVLGLYNFLPIPATKKFWYDQAALQKEFGHAFCTQWKEDGSVTTDMFSWWFECEIGDIILTEFEMYRHHLRRINGKANYGWLRSMFYSIGQQLMRQDPAYYALYVALRPDKCWRLVTYPHYAKYAQEGDNTSFPRIDLNIPLLLSSSRGGSMIQGSVSLDDEDETNCTVILPGMQHKLAAWWKRCCDQEQNTDGAVHRITDQRFTKEDAAALGVDWKRVPCRRGEVRVTLPHIPHGADGPSTGTRRTMLPWFVGLQDDLELLDVVEEGTWSELASAHRDLTAPKATPSGLANRHGTIPYRFPAATELVGLGALSDALVCRRKWDSPQVLEDRNVVLGADRVAAGEYVQQWRVRATALAVDAFKSVRKAEMEAFGVKSYFYQRHRFENEGIPMPVENSDEEPGEEGGDGFAEEGWSDGE